MVNLLEESLLFFDGASKNNPWRAGAGRIIIAPKGEEHVSFEWDLEEESNNRAEAYDLLLGVSILR